MCSKYSVHLRPAFRKLKLGFACFLIPLAPKAKEVRDSLTLVQHIPVRTLYARATPGVTAAVHEQDDLFKVRGCSEVCCNSPPGDMRQVAYSGIRHQQSGLVHFVLRRDSMAGEKHI